MAGPVCKAILNGLMASIMEALETSLTSPVVRGVMLKPARCDEYLDRMARLDLATYGAQATADSLGAILLDLERDGVVTPEVWLVLRRPGEVAA